MRADIEIVRERDSWKARCHFCDGPSYPWLTEDETWAKVELLLGQQQACFECFAAAWFALGLNDGEPFRVTRIADREQRLEAVAEQLGSQLVHWWHESHGGSDGTLAEFMGLTDEQYAAFVEQRYAALRDLDSGEQDE